MFRKKYSLQDRTDYHLKKIGESKTVDNYSLGFVDAVNSDGFQYDGILIENRKNKNFCRGFYAGVRAKEKARSLKW